MDVDLRHATLPEKLAWHSCIPSDHTMVQSPTMRNYATPSTPLGRRPEANLKIRRQGRFATGARGRAETVCSREDRLHTQGPCLAERRLGATKCHQLHLSQVSSVMEKPAKVQPNSAKIQKLHLRHVALVCKEAPVPLNSRRPAVNLQTATENGLEALGEKMGADSLLFVMKLTSQEDLAGAYDCVAEALVPLWCACDSICSWAPPLHRV